MGSKTLVLRVEMDPDTEGVVREFARETARWEQRAFGRWYADFRAHRSDLEKSPYKGLLSTRRTSARALGRKGSREKFRVNVQGRAPNLYSLFLTKGKRVEPAIQSRASHSALFGCLSHLGTAIENFLDYDLRRSRAHDRRVLRRRKEARARQHGTARKEWRPKDFYPRFKPIARFQHGGVRWEMQNGVPASFTVSHPFESRGPHLTLRFRPSYDPRYAERLQPLGDLLKSGKKVGIEVKYHDGGEVSEGWYAHVAVPFPEVGPRRAEPTMVMGVDVGERNPATFVVLDGPNADADRVGQPRLYGGLSTRDSLERQINRVRRLRSATDLGSRGARAALQRAKGKQSRVLNTLAHQVSHDVVEQAVVRKVDALAMEDLSKFGPGEKVRRKRMPFRGKRAKRLRRLLSRWNRGQVQAAIRYKAQTEGIRVAGRLGSGVFARGTSSTCPRCGKWDPSARNRSEHRFVCRTLGCGYSDNDDVTGAANIAARGYAYYHSPGSGKGDPTRKGPSTPHGDNPPQEPDRVSIGGDSERTSVPSEGAASTPQATVGGAVGSSSQPAENSENGVGAAVPRGNRPSPTGGVGRGISEPTTSRSDRTERKDTAGPASAEVVTPSRGGSRTDVRTQKSQGSDTAGPMLPGIPSQTAVFSPRPAKPAVATSGYRRGEWRASWRMMMRWQSQCRNERLSGRRMEAKGVRRECHS